MSLLTDFNPEFEYAKECYAYLLEREKQRPVIQRRSPQMQYRNVLVKRIEMLCVIHNMSSRVKYLSIFIMDVFMDNHSIVDDYLELVLICSLSIAAKVDERDNSIPKYRELLSEPNQYSRNEIFDIESKILKYFNWSFLYPTPDTYIDYFSYETKTNSSIRSSVDIYLRKSIDVEFYDFYPSIIAASCLYCARNKLNLFPIWPKSAQSLTKYSLSQLKDCVYELTKEELFVNFITTVTDGLPLIKTTIQESLDDSGFLEAEVINN